MTDERCSECGRGPAARVRFLKIPRASSFRMQKSATEKLDVTLCRACGETLYERLKGETRLVFIFGAGLLLPVEVRLRNRLALKRLQKLDDASAAGPGTASTLPPPPPVLGIREPMATRAQQKGSVGPRGWRKFFAIAGIVFAFPFFLTIPGWIALSAYRKWKAGERQQPTGLIAWGVIATLLLSFAFVIAAVEDPGPSAGSSAPPAAATPAVVVPPSISAPPGFTASEVGNGWTAYSSISEGFSISLPQGWHAAATNDLGPRLKFSAEDRDTSYAPVSGGGRPQLLALRLPASGQEIPKRYYEFVRLQFSLDPKIVGDVQMTTSALPSGHFYVLRAVKKIELGQLSVTMYGLLHDTFEYRLLFLAPLKHADEYYDEFDSIARTFSLHG